MENRYDREIAQQNTLLCSLLFIILTLTVCLIGTP